MGQQSMRKGEGSVKAKGPKTKSSQAHPLLFIGSCLDNAWEQDNPAGENIMKTKCTKLWGRRAYQVLSENHVIKKFCKLQQTGWVNPLISLSVSSVHGITCWKPSVQPKLVNL